jgi:hypothetical protein
MKDFDDLLAEVLKDDAVEPRIGMERRILARIREDGRRGFEWQRMGWFAAASLAACVLVAAVVQLRPGGRASDAAGPPQTAAVPSTAARTDPTSERPGPSPVKTIHRDGRADRGVANVHREAVRSESLQAEEERLPKLDTFPAVTQKDGLAATASPAVAQAMQELKAEQERPIVVAAIEIKPLEQETR